MILRKIIFAILCLAVISCSEEPVKIEKQKSSLPVVHEENADASPLLFDEINDSLIIRTVLKNGIAYRAGWIFLPVDGQTSDTLATTDVLSEQFKTALDTIHIIQLTSSDFGRNCNILYLQTGVILKKTGQKWMVTDTIFDMVEDPESADMKVMGPYIVKSEDWEGSYCEGIFSSGSVFTFIYKGKYLTRGFHFTRKGSNSASEQASNFSNDSLWSCSKYETRGTGHLKFNAKMNCLLFDSFERTAQYSGPTCEDSVITKRTVREICYKDSIGTLKEEEYDNGKKKIITRIEVNSFIHLVDSKKQ